MASRINPSAEINSLISTSAPNNLHIERKEESVISSMGARKSGKGPTSLFPILDKLFNFVQNYSKTLNSIKTPLLYSLTPATRLLFFILLVIACFSLTFLTGLLLAGPLMGTGIEEILGSLTDIEGAQTLRILQYFQVIQSIGLFIIPTLLAGYLFENNTPGFLKADRFSNGMVYTFVAIIMFSMLPLINWMVSVNEMMKLPGFLSDLESWMRKTEDQAARLTEMFMKMPDTGSFLFNLLMIAILPAIGEEFLFRGVLQRLLGDWIKNIHIAIFITAFLFAAMHLQFYGFLPRFMLGLLFGYLLYWSGSLWVPVVAHFLNNGAAVVVSFLGQHGVADLDYEHFGATNNCWIILLSAVVTALFLFLIRKKSIADGFIIH